MTIKNESVSGLIDGEAVSKKALDELLVDKEQLSTFSRYQLIGDAMRGEVADQFLDFDVSKQVMSKVNALPAIKLVQPIIKTPINTAPSITCNIVDFVKRFGQVAIAASVAGVVVLVSVITSTPDIKKSGGVEILNTIPFGGGAFPVSLQTNQDTLKKSEYDQHKYLEARLRDHQLQLQLQP
ncbi:MAG TPA: anti-sigma 24 factor [Psychromonas hadalis]|nr:anti-sigma 24 factor [Psychromonas hadalis]